MKIPILLALVFTFFGAYAQEKPLAEFKAKDFYKIDFQNGTRNTKWPKRLHFEALNVKDKEEFEQKIKGTWKYVSHCSGAALQYTTEEIDPKIDHHDKYVFDGDKVTFQHIQYDKVLAQFSDSYHYTVVPLGNGVFQLKTGSRYAPPPYSMVRILETGEIAIKDERPLHKCKNGEEPGALFVPFEMNLGV